MISVIVPVYNVELYLDECIESILQQTYRDFELILINDGSKDSCESRCLKWQKTDNRIIAVSKMNQGLGPTRDLGVRIARGDYIAFVDSDDWLAPEFLEKMLKELTKLDADLVVCDMYRVWKTNTEASQTRLAERATSRFLGRTAKKSMRGSIDVSWVNKLIKKSTYAGSRVFQTNHYCEDVASFPLFFSACKIVKIVKEPLYFYRQNPQGISASKAKGEDIFRAVCQSAEKFPESYEKFQFITYWFFAQALLEGQGLTDKRNSSAVNERARELLIQSNTGVYKYVRRVLVWGSFNLRNIAAYAFGSPAYLDDYSFSSLISAMSPEPIQEVPVHPSWYRNQMLQSDALKKPFSQQTSLLGKDYILIDFIEERFSIIQLEKGVLTKSDAFMEAWTESFPANWIVIESGSELFINLWKTACSKFVTMLKEAFSGDQIILVESYLCEAFGEYSKEKEYEHGETITHTNNILKTMYDYFKQQCPECIVRKAPESLSYTDIDFKYGCHPWHANEYYYRSVANELIDILPKEVV